MDDKITRKEVEKLSIPEDVFYVSSIGAAYEGPTGVSTYTAERALIVEDAKSNNRDYIYYGKDNQFPQYLLGLAKKSLLHKSILIAKANMVRGDGLGVKAITFLDDKEISEKEQQQTELDAKRYLDKIKINKFHAEAAWDMVVQGGCYPQLIYGKNEKALREVKRVIRSKFHQVRLGKPQQGDYGYIIKRFFIHDTWVRPRTEGEGSPIEVQSWDELVDVDNINQVGEAVKKQRTKDNYLHQIRIPNDITDWYAAPDYFSESALDYIGIDVEVAKFDLAELKNGMNAAYIITFFRKDYSKEDNELEEELRTKEDSLVRDSLVGSANNARVLITRRPPVKDGPKTVEITPIPSNNNDKRHNIITERKDIGILSAHGIVAPELAGIPDLTKSGFASQAERLVAANELLYWNRIKDFHSELETFYNRLLFEAGIKATVNILNSMPINAISDNMWQWGFTRDEYRNSKGFEPLTEEQLSEKEKEGTLKEMNESARKMEAVINQKMNKDAM